VNARRALRDAARPDLGWYLLALATSPLAAGLTVAQPWILRRTLDDGVALADAGALSFWATAFLVSAVASFAFEALYTWALALGASRTIARLRDAVFAHLCSLGASFHDREPSGRLLSRVTSDVDALGETLTAGAVTVVLDVLLVLGIAGSLLWMDWRLSLLLLLVAPPLALVVEVSRRRLRALFGEVRTTFAEVMSFLSERVRGVEVVQLAAQQDATDRAFAERVAGYRRASLRSNVWDAILFATVDGASAATMALLLYAGASPWAEDVVTAGLLAAFVDGVGKLFGPIRELSNKVAILQRAGASLEKLGAVLAVTERVPSGTEAPEGPPGALVIEGLSFAYEAGADVLRDVSFRVEPGRVVALVGRTGSGKSTVGKLLTASYAGWRGRIVLDGVDLRSWRHDALRRRIGVVPQDCALFPDTVRFNLTLGQPIPDERLRDALERARATAVVERLGGLDGHIGHGGRNLSVGEGQLVAIARVFCRDAPFVLLDEATASVDPVTEAAIREATRALMAERTVLVIAHRPSTIREADEIVVLDAGRVVERGTHAELVAREGAYTALVGDTEPA
jgi:ATP-binding cassette subfamily B multidrug efflux pump